MSDRSPLVSVILPVFNREDTVFDAIMSVLNQCVQDIELIVVDDKSTDNSVEIIQAIKDPRIRLIESDVNGGAGAARNIGIAQAKGKYIAFQDSDDIWLPKKLKRQLALFESFDEDTAVIYGGKIWYYEQGKASYIPEAFNAEESMILGLDRLVHSNRISVQTALFKREKIKLDYWFDESLRFDEDWEFAFRLVEGAKCVEMLEPYVLAFITDNSISVQRKPRLTLSTLKILRNHRSFFHNNPKFKAYLEYKLGNSLLSIGRRRLGLRFILSACLLSPLDIKKWLALAIKFLGFKARHG